MPLGDGTGPMGIGAMTGRRGFELSQYLTPEQAAQFQKLTPDQRNKVYAKLKEMLSNMQQGEDNPMSQNSTDKLAGAMTKVAVRGLFGGDPEYDYMTGANALYGIPTLAGTAYGMSKAGPALGRWMDTQSGITTTRNTAVDDLRAKVIDLYKQRKGLSDGGFGQANPRLGIDAEIRNLRSQRFHGARGDAFRPAGSAAVIPKRTLNNRLYDALENPLKTVRGSKWLKRGLKYGLPMASVLALTSLLGRKEQRPRTLWEYLFGS